MEKKFVYAVALLNFLSITCAENDLDSVKSQLEQLDRIIPLLETLEKSKISRADLKTLMYLCEYDKATVESMINSGINPTLKEKYTKQTEYLARQRSHISKLKKQ